MIVNNTCDPLNETSGCVAPTGSSAGLAAGLTLFFLLLVIAAGVIVYKYRSAIGNVLRLGSRKSETKEDHAETPQPDPHHYTSMIREQSTEQAPVYENLTRGAEYNRQAAVPSRLRSEPEEDLYLQCDLPDEVIYTNTNDPRACHEEDVYIVPDSL